MKDPKTLRTRAEKARRLAGIRTVGGSEDDHHLRVLAERLERDADALEGKRRLPHRASKTS